MQRRIRAAKVTFLTAAFLILAGFAIQGRVEARHYRRLLSNSYAHAFSELTTAAGELDTALQKTAYTTPGPLRQSLCQQVYAKALAAQYALGELPYGNEELEHTAAFLAKAGDYAAALSRDGGEDQEQALAALAHISGKLNAALLSIQAELDAGAVELTAVDRAERELAGAVERGGHALGGTVFQDIESDFPEMPSLIYDGPFSEHLSSLTPKALEGLGEITEEQARQTAAAFLQLSPDALRAAGTGEGVLPTYAFIALQHGGTGYIEVTRQGGAVLEYFWDGVTGQPVITVDQAVELAKNHLASWGFPRMETSYHIQREGVLTIHFAPVVDDVYCYPDLVKVTLALDSGRLLGYEAHGYLGQHRARSFEAPAVTREQAMAAVPGNLRVLSDQLALIPTAGGTGEVLTYEFKCQDANGRHVLIYVNAQTGLQQNILLLLEDETGTLTL